MNKFTRIRRKWCMAISNQCFWKRCNWRSRKCKATQKTSSTYFCFPFLPNETDCVWWSWPFWKCDKREYLCRFLETLGFLMFVIAGGLFPNLAGWSIRPNVLDLPTKPMQWNRWYSRVITCNPHSKKKAVVLQSVSLKFWMERAGVRTEF